MNDSIICPIDLNEIEAGGTYVIKEQSSPLPIRAFYCNQWLRNTMVYAYNSLANSYRHSNGTGIILGIIRR